MIILFTYLWLRMPFLACVLGISKPYFAFISEYVEEGFINIIFIGKDSNDAETFTKNESRESFEKYMFNLLGKVPKG